GVALGLRDGSVVTMDAVRRRASAVAVDGGRVVAVGGDADVRPMIGRATVAVDLAGRMLIPGFQDAHVHPVGGGLDMLQCDLHHLSSAQQYVRAIADYAAEHPERPWILGGGW